MKIDRRLIYFFVFLALAWPLLTRWSVPAARMEAAEKLFEMVESANIQSPDVAVVAFDFGPSLVAENGTQAEVVLEHLMRRRVPVALFSLYIQAEPFLKSIPDKIVTRLQKEFPNERWEYGRDWINLGFRPNGMLMVQGLQKTENIAELFGTDARGNKLSESPIFRGVKTLENIKLLVEISGLVGMLDTYVAFFQKGNYRPAFGHGCTSITIPEAFIYLDSGQIKGLLEGISGAAWYSTLLQRKYVNRVPDRSGVTNTALGVAHGVILLLIIAGNITGFRRKRE
jgi:hypothetical protein